MKLVNMVDLKSTPYLWVIGSSPIVSIQYTKKSKNMFKNSRLVGSLLSPFKKLTSKQTANLKPRRLKNRFAVLLQQKRLSKFFYKRYRQGTSLTSLEKKIDVALFRANFCSSIRAARQAILHKKVLVNTQILERPNYILKPGDIFSISSKTYSPLKLSRKSPSFEINYATSTAIYLFPPQFVTTPFQWQKSN